MPIDKAGVSFQGAHITYSDQRSAELQKQHSTQQRMLEEQRNAQQRSEAKKAADTSNKNQEPSHKNKPLHHSAYLPGRLSSQYTYRAEGHPSITDGPQGPNKGYNTYSEIIPFSIASPFKGGQIKGCVIASVGPRGAIHGMFIEKENGELTPVKHNTNHVAGNYHIHPNEQDKSKSYFVAPQNWYGKDGILSQIIDKGRKKKDR